MPALPDVSKVLRVALSGTIGPNVWLTRFYIAYTGTAPTAAQLATFDAAIVTTYTTNLKPLSISGNALLQVETIDLSSVTSAIDITAANVVGNRTGGTLPAQICMVTSYEIGRRYRGGHPRGYWVFGTDTDVAGAAIWSNAFLTSVSTGVNAFFTAIFAAGWTGAGTLSHVNVSYYKGFTVVVNPITGRARNVPTLRVTPTVDQVTSIAPRVSFGTQRRREAFVD